MDKMPRHRLRPNFSEMLPGEKGWFTNYAVNIFEDGSVYIDNNARLLKFHNTQPWPDHNKGYGDFLVEKTQNGTILNIFSGDNFTVCNYDLDDSFLAANTKITEIIEHDYYIESCKTCDGCGFLKKKK